MNAHIDQPERAICRLINWDSYGKALPRRSAQLDHLVRRSVGAQFDGHTLQPEAAESHLHSIRLFVESEAKRMIGRYSPFRWLWYLRRLPGFVFSGELATTEGYDFLLAETLTSQSETSSPFQTAVDGSVCYRIKSDVIEVLTDFCITIRYLSNIHSNLRMCGKGAEVVFNGDGPAFGAPRPTEALAHAVRLYDQRIAKHSNPWAIIGTSESGDPSLKESRVLILDRTGPMLGTIRLPSGVQSTASVRFIPKYASLESLLILAHDTRLDHDWTGPVIPALLTFLKAMEQFGLQSNLGFSRIKTRGYSILSETEFFNHLESVWRLVVEFTRHLLPNSSIPDSPKKLVELITNTPGTLWPVKSGPAIRYESGLFCCDLYGATTQLLTHLQFPESSGDPGNARGEHFEAVIQAQIDQTPWKPLDTWRAYVRRSLRLRGQPLTDLDAIGQYGDVLLLVSCKSRVYSRRYDVGDRATIRNAESAVNDAVVAWAEKVAALQANPVGDNYDFSSVRRMIGVVVLPHVVFANRGRALECIEEGLYAASSAHELYEWLLRFKPI